MLSQINPVHTSPSYFLKIHFNIIFSFMLNSSKWPRSLRFPHQSLYGPLLSPIRATCPAHLIILDLITRIIFSAEQKSRCCSSYNGLHAPLTPSHLFPTTVFTCLSVTYCVVLSCLSVSCRAMLPCLSYTVQCLHV
jgi:hypothetical protein